MDDFLNYDILDFDIHEYILKHKPQPFYILKYQFFAQNETMFITIEDVFKNTTDINDMPKTMLDVFKKHSLIINYLKIYDSDKIINIKISLNNSYKIIITEKNKNLLESFIT